MQRRCHVAATRYLDTLLLNAVAKTSINRISNGDFHQVVLMADGMDTRPFRLLWPEGTVMFLIASRRVVDFHTLK